MISMSSGSIPIRREIVLMSPAANEEDGIDFACANTFIKNLLF